jgi:hypothetical protein
MTTTKNAIKGYELKRVEVEITFVPSPLVTEAEIV